jgi:hypothetical protein
MWNRAEKSPQPKVGRDGRRAVIQALEVFAGVIVEAGGFGEIRNRANRAPLWRTSPFDYFNNVYAAAFKSASGSRMVIEFSFEGPSVVFKTKLTAARYVSAVGEFVDPEHD